MKQFPNQPPYDSKCRPFNINYSVVPSSTSIQEQSQPISIFITYKCRSDSKIVQSKMYEPVSDQCVTSTIINPRYSSNRAGVYDRTCNNTTESECCADCVVPPEKPPRKCKPQHFQQAGKQNTMRNGNGDSSTIDVDHINLENHYKKFADVTVQTTHLVPYRLRYWPKLFCDVKLSPSEKNCTKLRLQCCGRVLSQWLLSQFGLTIILIAWALLGAFAFFKTEGPRELEQSEQLADIQKELSKELSTDLKGTKEDDTGWPKLIHKYLEKHETMLLEAVSAGFGEGGGGSIWTYPGCILFAVSLLTTLGFGAPVPRTTLGRCAAVIFSAIGIPLHFLLILNMGNLAAIKLQQFAYNSPSTDFLPTSTEQPRWLKLFPFFSIATYYLMGVLMFGFVRQRSPADCFMFPLDFTAAGGVASVNGHVRILYALYLELAVTLAALVLSLIQASASRGIVDIGLRLGILTNT